MIRGSSSRSFSGLDGPRTAESTQNPSTGRRAPSADQKIFTTSNMIAAYVRAHARHKHAYGPSAIHVPPSTQSRLSISSRGRDDGDDADVQHYYDISHLPLQALGITGFERSAFHSFLKLRVLYLYDNEVASLDPLSALPCLDQLYVQGNRLTSLDPLSGMAYLTIIDASGNSIFRISNLQLPSLKELHLERQVSAPKGLFDARGPLTWSLDIVAGTNELPELTVLTLSHTRLGIMDGIAELDALEVLTMSDCGIHDYSVLEAALSRCSQLRTVDLTQNPVMSTGARLRDKIILGHRFLESLNGKEISQVERQFLFNWMHRKDAKRLAQRGDRADSGDGAADPSRPPSLDASKVPTLPPIRSSSKAISTRRDSGGRGSTRGTLLSSFDK
ncbi:hypothetical protein AMAG_20260 [Allomyces macrogynus ATCC 38327]|uniref:Uncharacterized protein n=1 Tax=Allomyces macrogynus (strain ATCC 38327) TaxID=578462 RepID=A0A0L0T646_ALLM3|nr:hypothetical protein AMAG_20260 [Allomyces macrogynus ATCC 38327]|eukprot:KNE70232.1 hypothetical protein AMAG_20260 [Allomyces macrogynus ATCC 38327]